MNSISEWVRTFPPAESEGWTLTTIERQSRYWLTAQVGRREQELFERRVGLGWQWAAPAKFIRWFSDGERRYAQELSLVYRQYSIALRPSEPRLWASQSMASEVRSRHQNQRISG